MDVGKEFDSITEGYSNNMTRWVPYYREMLIQIVNSLPMEFYPNDILDLGAGNGNVTALLLNQYPDANYSLVDISEKMLGTAAQRFKNKSNLHYELVDFQSLNFPDQKFDLITAGITLHHLLGKEKKVLFQKLFKWLNPGGFFCCSDLFVCRTNEPYHTKVIAGWKNDAFQRGTTPDEWKWIMDHYNTFDFPNSFEDQHLWLTQAGFKNPKITWQVKAWGTILAKKEEE